MRVERCRVGKAEIPFRVVDDGQSGETLVCAGGLGGTHLVWNGLARLLRARHRLVIWDYPGLSAGGSLGHDVAVDVASLARYQAAVMDAAGAERAVVLGWSLGVQVGFEMARQGADRVRALVAICGVAGRPFAGAPEGATLFDALGLRAAFPSAVGWVAGHEEALEAVRAVVRRLDEPTRWAVRLGIVDPIVDRLVFDAVIRDYLAIPPRVYRRYLEAASVHDATDMLASCGFPVVALAGERDRFLPPARVRAMAEAIPGARYFEVRGATHYLPLEYPDIVALRVEELVGRLSPR